jgi:hypothetical protein|tara:strand:- start:788 stop:979 length:192 start_codon:yes stop_codon:yes gene_type:complete
MERVTLGILAVPILFALLSVGEPIGLAMLIVGVCGTAIIAAVGYIPAIAVVTRMFPDVVFISS